MRPTRLVAALACLAMLALGAPAMAAGYQVPASGNATGTFWVTPPTGGHYTCPMDPDVLAEAPGICPKCNMDLEAAGTILRLAMSPVYAGRGVKLTVVGKERFSARVTLGANGAAETAFPLPPGAYQLVAELTAPGSGKHLKLTAPYQLR